MNPLLASPRLETVAGQDLNAVHQSELVFLEGLLNDDCKCESKHKYTPYCSGDVSYLITYCTGEYKSCKSSVEDLLTGTLKRMNTPGMKCLFCGNLASDCWTIRPI